MKFLLCCIFLCYWIELSASSSLEVADWQVKQLELELESVDLRSFSPQTILTSYNRVKDKLAGACYSVQVYYVQICDDQSVFINGVLAENQRSNLAKFMLKLRDTVSCLPPCSFLYTRNGQNLLKYKLQQVPVLVGSKFSGSLKNQITFIEECSTVGLMTGSQKEWFGEYVTQEVLNHRDNLTWDQKIPKCVWRGYLSDTMHAVPFQASDRSRITRLSPRMIIAILSCLYPNFIDAKITNINPVDKQRILSGKREVAGILKLNHSNYPLGLNGSLQLYPRATIEDQLKYRYQIALDGVHATNPGYLWRMLSGSLTFKQESPFSQWFYAGLKPNVHFIPVKRDLSDLLKKIQYAINHDAASEKIACQARGFAESRLYPDRFFEHAHYVLLRYAQKQEQAMKFNTSHM